MLQANYYSSKKIHNKMRRLDLMPFCVLFPYAKILGKNILGSNYNRIILKSLQIVLKEICH